MEFIKINRTKAKRLYSEGKIIYLVPCKVYPDFKNCWVKPHTISLEQSQADPIYNHTFDDLVNSFDYYNCIPELGKYPHFYIEKENK
jgi:hypothetical protein